MQNNITDEEIRQILIDRKKNIYKAIENEELKKMNREMLIGAPLLIGLVFVGYAISCVCYAVGLC